MKHLVISTLVGALLVTGCSKKETTTTEPVKTQTTTETVVKPATKSKKTAVKPKGSTIIVNGSEPDWHFTISGKTAIYKSPLTSADGIKIAVTRAGQPNGVQLKGVLEGEDFVLALTKNKCEDPMSGTKYPMTASFLKSDGTYGGCAKRE